MENDKVRLFWDTVYFLLDGEVIGYILG